MKQFLKCESGAVTVDWVVITAMIVFFCVAVLGVFSDATEISTVNVGTKLHTVGTNMENAGD